MMDDDDLCVGLSRVFLHTSGLLKELRERCTEFANHHDRFHIDSLNFICTFKNTERLPSEKFKNLKLVEEKRISEQLANNKK